MKCTKVTLRSRPISGGRRSLYLDYYPPVRDPDTQKIKAHEGLGMYIYSSPKNSVEQEHNKTMLTLGRAVAGRRLESILKGDFGFLDESRAKGDFLAYFANESEKHNSTWSSCQKHLSRLYNGKLTFAELNTELVNRFHDYLFFEAEKIDTPGERISWNTAVTYWCSFYGILCCAKRDKYLREPLHESMVRENPKETKIEFLIHEELSRLVRTPCEIEVLKRASLFSCLTGLRISDIEKLKWSDIVPSINGGFCIRTKTKKTKAEATLPISVTMLSLCGERKPAGKVFEGINREMLREPLKKWIKDAGITKHITFHCFRHTYAVLQLAAGTDIYTLSRMMTHKSVTSTEKYLALLDPTMKATLGRIAIEIDETLK